MFYLALQQGHSESDARNMLLLLLVLFENFQTFASRSERKSVLALGVFGNPLLLFCIAAALGLHIIAMHVPLVSITLQVSPMEPAEWAMLLTAASSVLFTMEFDKWRLRGKSTA
ncbi:calcium-translocating P-type ATPase, SERCA-type [compost metagenome]